MQIFKQNNHCRGFTPLENISISRSRSLTGFTPLGMLGKRKRLPKGNLSLTGFTFIELFVVITILSLLLLAIYATFASGMKVWRKIQDTTLVKRKALLSLERFCEDLRQMSDFSKIGFLGKQQELFFPLISANNVCKITYSIEKGSFYRKEQNFKDILEDKNNIQIKLLLSGIEDLQFKYAYIDLEKKEYYFKDTWEKEGLEGIPFAVNIDLKTKEGEFVKTVLLNIYK